MLLPLFFITSGDAHAAATPAGTEINNIAKINYEIIGFPQPEINTPAGKFLVDRKLDVNVSEANCCQQVELSGLVAHKLSGM